jgi:hypothetical protein
MASLLNGRLAFLASLVLAVVEAYDAKKEDS